jgi:hypothetical protein
VFAVVIVRVKVIGQSPFDSRACLAVQVGFGPHFLTYVCDVLQTQLLCSQYATKFNKKMNGKTKLHFLPTWCIKTQDGVFGGVEPFVEGEFVKYNDNNGEVFEPGLPEAQAFSHFSWQSSKGMFLICDIQGWGEVLKHTHTQKHTQTYTHTYVASALQVSTHPHEQR